MSSLAGLMAGEESHWMILLKVRVPRTISLLLAGAVMSLCGKIIQHLMQNKFVAADVIGLTDSARLGILIVMLWLPNASGTPANNRCFLIFLCGGFAIFMAKLLDPEERSDGFAFNGCDVRECDWRSQFLFLAYRFQLVHSVILLVTGELCYRDRGQL